MKKLPDKITNGDKYNPAMKITGPIEAKEYFEACVEHMMRSGISRDEAESIERNNLGYWAGYYGHDTRLRVEELFGCAHPIFGSAVNGPPNPLGAFLAGFYRGLEDKKGRP